MGLTMSDTQIQRYGIQQNTFNHDNSIKTNTSNLQAIANSAVSEQIAKNTINAASIAHNNTASVTTGNIDASFALASLKKLQNLDIANFHKLYADKNLDQKQQQFLDISFAAYIYQQLDVLNLKQDKTIAEIFSNLQNLLLSNDKDEVKSYTDKLISLSNNLKQTDSKCFDVLAHMLDVVDAKYNNMLKLEDNLQKFIQDPSTQNLAKLRLDNNACIGLTSLNEAIKVNDEILAYAQSTGQINSHCQQDKSKFLNFINNKALAIEDFRENNQDNAYITQLLVKQEQQNYTAKLDAIEKLNDLKDINNEQTLITQDKHSYFTEHKDELLTKLNERFTQLLKDQLNTIIDTSKLDINNAKHIYSLINTLGGMEKLQNLASIDSQTLNALLFDANNLDKDALISFAQKLYQEGYNDNIDLFLQRACINSDINFDVVSLISSISICSDIYKQIDANFNFDLKSLTSDSLLEAANKVATDKDLKKYQDLLPSLVNNALLLKNFELNNLATQEQLNAFVDKLDDSFNKSLIKQQLGHSPIVTNSQTNSIYRQLNVSSVMLRSDDVIDSYAKLNEKYNTQQLQAELKDKIQTLIYDQTNSKLTGVELNNAIDLVKKHKARQIAAINTSHNTQQLHLNNQAIEAFSEELAKASITANFLEKTGQDINNIKGQTLSYSLLYLNMLAKTQASELNAYELDKFKLNFSSLNDADEVEYSLANNKNQVSEYNYSLLLQHAAKLNHCDLDTMISKLNLEQDKNAIYRNVAISNSDFQAKKEAIAKLNLNNLHIRLDEFRTHSTGSSNDEGRSLKTLVRDLASATNADTFNQKLSELRNKFLNTTYLSYCDIVIANKKGEEKNTVEIQSAFDKVRDKKINNELLTNIESVLKNTNIHKTGIEQKQRQIINDVIEDSSKLFNSRNKLLQNIYDVALTKALLNYECATQDELVTKYLQAPYAQRTQMLNSMVDTIEQFDINRDIATAYVHSKLKLDTLLDKALKSSLNALKDKVSQAQKLLHNIDNVFASSHQKEIAQNNLFEYVRTNTEDILAQCHDNQSAIVLNVDKGAQVSFELVTDVELTAGISANNQLKLYYDDNNKASLNIKAGALLNLGVKASINDLFEIEGLVEGNADAAIEVKFDNEFKASQFLASLLCGSFNKDDLALISEYSTQVSAGVGAKVKASVDLTKAMQLENDVINVGVEANLGANVGYDIKYHQNKVVQSLKGSFTASASATLNFGDEDKFDITQITALAANASDSKIVAIANDVA